MSSIQSRTRYIRDDTPRESHDQYIELMESLESLDIEDAKTVHKKKFNRIFGNAWGSIRCSVMFHNLGVYASHYNTKYKKGTIVRSN
jgi:hypothetical protein